MSVSSSMRSWQARAMVIGLVAIGAGLRLWHLGEQSLWVDEVYTHRISSLPLNEILGARPSDKPPLDYLFVHVAMRLLGDSEAAMRVPAMLWGALTPLALGGLVGSLFGRAAGLTALVALVFSPFHMRYSQEARPYALMMFTTALATWSLVEIRKRDGGHRLLWIVHVLSCLAAVWTHFLAILWLVLLQIWCWSVWLRGRGTPNAPMALGLAKGAAASHAAALVTLIPLWRWAPHGESAGAEAPFNFVPHEVVLDFNAFVFGSGHHQHLRHAGAVGLALALVGAVWAWRKSPAGASLLLLLCAGMWGIPLLFYWAIDHWIAPRYFTGGLLPLVALMALGAVAFAAMLGHLMPSRWGTPTRRSTIALVTLLSAHSVFAGIWMVRNQHAKKDWRALVDWLGESRPPGHVVVVTNSLNLDTLGHYAPRRGVAIVPMFLADLSALRHQAEDLGDCTVVLPWETESGPVHDWLSAMGPDECPLDDFQAWRVISETN